MQTAPHKKEFTRATATVRETTQITGLCPAYIYVLLNNGKLRSTHIGRRRLIYVESIEELLGTKVA